MVKIIDASIGIEWFLNSPRQQKVLDVMEEVLKSPRSFAVPELFFFELTHVFHRVIPTPTKKQLGLFEGVMKFGLQRFSMSSELFREVRKFQARGLSGYDSAYVALAKLLHGKWITLDQKAHSKIEDLKLSEVL